MIYVISDVHGHYTEFIRLLKKVRFCEGDKLYLLGDVVDRGTENLKMLEFCRSRSNVILLKGNHELFMQRYLEGSLRLVENWKFWGGDTTLKELENSPKKSAANGSGICRICRIGSRSRKTEKDIC